MIISYEDFLVLRDVYNRSIQRHNYKFLEDEKTKLSHSFLRNHGYIEDDESISKLGLEALEPYKVKNAIILAAGMSTRFAPISYELPKGLISVKGERLIERLIVQLQEAGINEIVVVVGYMMEKFIYLRDKYGVKLVVNNEFFIKNTHSSIYAARDYLSNTYICCSDNYYPMNMFELYEYRAFYCSIFLPGTSYVERGFVFDKDELIIDTNKPSQDQWIMYGHAFFSNCFSTEFRPILENYYGKPGVENMYWETVYSENVKKLPMWGLKCDSKDILEFDSMEELKEFDPNYIVSNRIKVFENICRILCCELQDISDIEIITTGLNNRSFKFKCNDKYYIYRHPGANANAVIDRSKEAAALRMAKKYKIDDTLIYIDESEGWKISKFITVTDTFDFSNHQHIRLLAEELKKLRDEKPVLGFAFDYKKEVGKIYSILKTVDPFAYMKALELSDKMEKIFKYLDMNPWQISACHNDLYQPNLLISGEKLFIIDWEFAGDNDIGYDICKLFSLEKPSYEEIDDWVWPYFERKITDDEKIHLLACSAIIYYYWYVWGIFANRNNSNVSDYILGWFDKMQYYSEEVLKRI